MSNLGTYSKAVIRKAMVNGVDMTNNIRQLYVGSSILAPYMVSKLLMMDGSRIQDALYESGVPVSLVYSSGDGSTVREIELVSMANLGGMKLESNRMGGAEFVAISQSYFNMQGEHTSAHQNIPACEALKKLHKEVDSRASLNVAKCKGMIADQEPFHLRGVKLGQGVNNIRGRMTDEKYKSGAYTYFMDLNGEYHSKPLEQLADEAGQGGPTFSQYVGGKSFIADQRRMAFNIFSMQKGGPSSDYGSDNSSKWQSATKQRGGDKPPTEAGFNWSSLEYKKPTEKDHDPSSRKTQGDTKWAGEKPKAPQMVNHSFMYDQNQKKNPDFEGDIANQNVMSKISMQGSVLANMPMEGGLQCMVGKGCNLDIPSEVGEGGFSKSSAGGAQLIVAQGEYIFLGDNGMQGVVSIQTSSGGKQGSIA